jgi:hypothetical protein
MDKACSTNEVKGISYPIVVVKPQEKGPQGRFRNWWVSNTEKN